MGMSSGGSSKGGGAQMPAPQYSAPQQQGSQGKSSGGMGGKGSMAQPGGAMGAFLQNLRQQQGGMQNVQNGGQYQSSDPSQMNSLAMGGMPTSNPGGWQDQAANGSDPSAPALMSQSGGLDALRKSLAQNSMNSMAGGPIGQAASMAAPKSMWSQGANDGLIMGLGGQPQPSAPNSQGAPAPAPNAGPVNPSSPAVPGATGPSFGVPASRGGQFGGFTMQGNSPVISNFNALMQQHGPNAAYNYMSNNFNAADWQGALQKQFGVAGTNTLLSQYGPGGSGYSPITRNPDGSFRYSDAGKQSTFTLPSGGGLTWRPPS